MGAGAFSLLGLGLTMGFSPTLYGISLHLLTRDRRATSAIRWMVVGLAAGSTVMVVLFQFIDPGNLELLLRHQVAALLLRRGVDLVSGALLIGASIVVALRLHEDRVRPPGPVHHRQSGAGGHRWQYFVIGMSNTVLGVSGIATMYLTGRVVSGTGRDLVERVLLYAVFLVALVGPYLIVAHLWTRLARFAASVTRCYDVVARVDFHWLAAGGLLLAGLLFLSLGLWRPV
ncbi:hypothetical protein [Microlunatus endophyticus]|uniref:hypothetical protein n=1 Tax=Microlunatus endophyticus TaxID=1716077 RepID=UPI00166595D4|nr:hypothetical protein [Microlunatus endophyticus]